MSTYWAPWAWLPDGPAADVRIEVTDDGTLGAVVPHVSPTGTPLPGVVYPGFANAHSHAFHRALRGRTHVTRGSFWVWRQLMYELAERLTPARYLALATATYAEMALAGVTCVGEFHYVHHGANGRRYANANEMSDVLREATRRAGVRLTILDTCYLAAGFGRPVDGAQMRFSDGDADAWAQRHSDLKPDASTRIGSAIHSVRAVPAEQIPIVARASENQPLHLHLSEQPAENDECIGAYAATPTQLLRDHGVLGPDTTVVHATHLSDNDIRLLGTQRVTACLCPTTERDLADGLGHGYQLATEGCNIAVGSDQHAVIDLLEEARGIELHDRLGSGQRGRFRPEDLVETLTASGHRALGWPEAGRLEPGAPADLVAVRLDTPRTAGVDPAQLVMAAFAADVDTVIVGGRTVVRGGQHGLGDVAALMARAIAEIHPR